MNNSYEIGDELSLSEIQSIITSKSILKLSKNLKNKIKDCRSYLDKEIAKTDNIIYGINTGFGALCNNTISVDELCELQSNLVLSHACGIGEEVPQEVVKIMLLLKVHSLALGYSGVQLETVERLIDMFNSDVLPVVYQQGSLGASGDLSPLAHLSLPLIGEGEVDVPDICNKDDYKRRKSSTIMKEMDWQPIRLQSKEGLALLNGTQFMSAYGVWCLLKAQRISYLSDIIGSISLEAFNCKSDFLDELLHMIRPHMGQIETAKNIRKILHNSDIQKLNKESVQDPYSFRCIPQVHGATKDIISHVKSIFTTEANSVTDNPTIFLKQAKIISGGNFHGQPLAMAMDYLAIGISELGSISERRTYQLISGERGLPSFLVLNPGLNSGMMIPQYTAASIVSQNKQLCTPSSVDSIVSSNGQEDHVSMGANSATKLYKVIENTEKILAIELLNAAQAIAFRNSKSSDFIENILNQYRLEVDFLDTDRLLYKDIKKSINFLRKVNIDTI